MSKVNWTTVWIDPDWRHQLTNAVIAAFVVGALGVIGTVIYKLWSKIEIPLFGYVCIGAILWRAGRLQFSEL